MEKKIEDARREFNAILDYGSQSLSRKADILELSTRIESG